MKYVLSLSLLFIFLTIPCLSSADDSFTMWLQDLRTEAIAKGISETTLDNVLKDLKPVPRVIELDRNQPEFKRDFWSYLDLTVTESRIKKGRRLLKEHREILEKVQQEYGVQPRVLVAIWGLETNFGSHTGSFSVVSAVATLAHDTRRSRFFRKELFNVLKILDEGHINLSDMSGSWAGAMGQLQFMPSTFVSFAVDANNDGRKDIWQNLPDVFASAANFLSKHGWNGKYIWGREVLVPEDINSKLYGIKTIKSVIEWQKIGVRRINGEDLPDLNLGASLIQPSKGKGPYFLVYQNYRAIMRWNYSNLYALAVCHLSDRLAGGQPLQK